VEIGGDLGLAYRDPWGLRACVLSVSWDQPHCVASVRAVIHGFFKQLTVPQPSRSELLDATMCAKITLVLRHDYPGQVCSIANSLEVIGERWSLLIVRDVLNGNRRFGELQGSLGIARNVLSSRLQRLLDEDILERRRYQDGPARYEYFLTEKGLGLWPALIALLNWGDRYSPSPGGPPKLIVHKECGGRVSDRGTCEECGQVLNARDARQVPGPGSPLALAGTRDAKA
jgi:DNA-binding HxlR family transcriptional regulator